MNTGLATPVIGHGENNLDTGINLSEASQSDVFQNLAKEMFGEDIEETLEDETTEEEVEVEEVVEDETTEEDETEEEVSEETVEESDEEEAEESEETEAESEVFVIKVDGEELEVGEDELLNGYQRQKDYTRKTQELATERKEVVAKVKELSEEREKYLKAMESLVDADKAALKEYDKVDWAKLKEEDQSQFLMLQYEMNEKRAALQTKVSERNAAMEKAEADKRQASADFFKLQNERAKTLVDGWQGAEHDKLVESLQGQADSIGFTESENELFKHAIVIKLLQKAQAYDDLKTTQKEVVEKKIRRKVPKVVKSGTPKKEVNKVAKKANASFDKLKQTGNIKDSVDAFAAFL